MKRLLFVCAYVGLLGGRSAADERVHRYHADITVNADGALDVRETIVVNAEGRNIRRGIYRDFPTDYVRWSFLNVKVPFEVISALRNGNGERFRTERLVNGTRIYLGDGARTIPRAEHTYDLHYRTDFQLGYFDDHDELYWNVTGNGWVFPIDAASATVRLPPGTSGQDLKLEAYTGFEGTRGTSYDARVDPATGAAFFETTAPLRAYEGLTIVVGFPKGIVRQPSIVAVGSQLVSSNPYLAAALAGLFATLGYFGAAWFRVGRDPAAGTIIPRFEVPRNLSPAAVRFVREMAFDDRCFATAVVSMAVRGHVRIDEYDEDYVLQKQADVDTLSDGEDAMSSIMFPFGTTNFRLDSENYEAVGKARRALEGHLSREYEGTLFFKNRGWLIPGVLLAALSALLAFYHHVHTFIAVAVLVVPVCLLFAHLLERPGVLGQRLRDQIEGFRMYLKTAEGDTLRTMRPPQVTTELFEQFLPYAVALGVENEWGDQFARAASRVGSTRDPSMSTYRPRWYSGDVTDFRPARMAQFAGNLGSSLSSRISSASTPPGSSSGFSSGGGGGGSSGGGGGGGGGGGW